MKRYESLIIDSFVILEKARIYKYQIDIDSATSAKKTLPRE